MKFIKFVLLIICSSVVLCCDSFQKKQNKIATELNCNLEFDEWNEFKSDRFLFQKPSHLSLKSFTNFDSNVWSFSSDDTELVVDSGIYSGYIDIYKNQTDYSESNVLIDDIESTLISFELKKDYGVNYKHKFLTALFIPSSKTEDHGIAFWVNYKSHQQKATICSVLSTIKLDKEP